MIENSKLTKTGWELESVSIVQTPISFIDHRSECNPKIWMCGREVYPVIVAPMGAVTNANNYDIWLKNGFICVVPRTVDINERIEISSKTFSSFSLSEAETLLMNKEDDGETTHYICIDIAHGTMSRLYQTCKKLKEKFGNRMVIMTGNVATPDCYSFYADAGIDYMRCCIGTGSRCTTSCNVGVHYPTATLIDELRMQKDKWERNHGTAPTKLIVDGGISNFDDIQKCIALGAEAVMSGQIFAKAEEACEGIVFLHPEHPNLTDAIPADEYFKKLEYFKEFEDEVARDAYNKLAKRKPYRKYYGMSTKYAQTITGGSGKKTSEGIIKPVPVEYPIAKWAENMKDYMISCMSYTGFKTVEEMREGTELIINLSGDKSFRK